MSWRREPLVYFLLLSAAVLAIDRCAGANAGAAGARIVVTAAQIERLNDGFQRTWQRPPSQKEMDDLVEDYVRTEVLAREAVAMGLDRDDPVIRRRLRLQMDSLADHAGRTKPSEEDLRAYLADHPDAFRAEPRYTFKQIYLDPNRRGAALDRDVAALLAMLNQMGDSDADLARLGDATLLGHEFSNVARRDIAVAFGERFASGVTDIELGKWYGPVPSGYGVHVVRVSERQEGRVPPFEEIRAAVAREWAAERNRASKQHAFAALRDRYVVRVEPARAEVAVGEPTDTQPAADARR